MSFISQSDVERLDGHNYYYLHVSNSYTLFVQIDGVMYKLLQNVPDLTSAKNYARLFSKIRKEMYENDVQMEG